MATYGTVNNDTGSVLTFGAVSGRVTKSDAATGTPVTYTYNSKTTTKTFTSGGTINPYGSYVIFAGGQTTINSLSNAVAAQIGSSVPNQVGGPVSARKVGVSAISRLTNALTYVSGSWTTFNYRNKAANGNASDSIKNSIESPYSLPATFSYLGPMTPATVSYSTAE
jgi:hypothetical protein